MTGVRRRPLRETPKRCVLRTFSPGWMPRSPGWALPWNPPGGGVKFERPLPILALPASRRGISLMRQRSKTARRSLAVAVVALLAAVAAVAAPPAQAVTNCSPSSSWGTNRADLASQVVGLINQYRAGKGLSQLAVSAPLTASSEWKSLHMAGYGYFAHNDPAPPVSRSAYQRARDCGYGGCSWGENIAWGYATRTVRRQRLARLLRPQGEHREPRLQLHRRRRRSQRQRPALLDTELRQRRSRRHAAHRPPPRHRPLSTPAPRHPLLRRRLRPVTAPGLRTAPPRDPAASTAPAAGSTPVKTALSRSGPSPPTSPGRRARSRLAASVPFVQMATGRPLTAGSVRCRAEVDGKRLRVVANVFRAQAARCAWRIPTWAKGKQLTGVVAVQIDGAAATRLFMRTLE